MYVKSAKCGYVYILQTSNNHNTKMIAYVSITIQYTCYTIYCNTFK